MDSFLRRATPVVLLLLAALAWFEKWLPGHEAVASRFGDDAVLRFVLGLLCVYVVLLVVECQRLEQAFKQLLGAFKDFHAQARRGGTAGAESAAAKREAVELLVAALSSGDLAIRQKARKHLARLTGEDLGEDPQAWRAWLDRRQDAGTA